MICKYMIYIYTYNYIHIISLQIWRDSASSHFLLSVFFLARLHPISSRTSSIDIREAGLVVSLIISYHWSPDPWETEMPSAKPSVPSTAAGESFPNTADLSHFRTTSTWNIFSRQVQRFEPTKVESHFQTPVLGSFSSHSFPVPRTACPANRKGFQGQSWTAGKAHEIVIIVKQCKVTHPFEKLTSIPSTSAWNGHGCKTAHLLLKFTHRLPSPNAWKGGCTAPHPFPKLWSRILPSASTPLSRLATIEWNFCVV